MKFVWCTIGPHSAKSSAVLVDARNVEEAIAIICSDMDEDYEAQLNITWIVRPLSSDSL